jgi:hypothetical protein
MISKDESIVTQVAAKIASELTTHTHGDATIGDVQATYLSHFDFVRELLVSTHGFNEVVAVTNSPKVSVDTRANDIAEQFDASYTVGSGIQIKGTQHGPIPAWLVTACAKAGVTAVWDNRDTANAQNKRPLFKSADGKTNPQGQPLAFWQPRN